MESLTRKQKQHLAFLEMLAQGDLTPAQHKGNKAISTERGAELVALDAATVRIDSRDKRRRVYSITETGRLYLNELLENLINEPEYLRDSLDKTLRSYHGGSSTGAFMLIPLMRDEKLYHSAWLKNPEFAFDHKVSRARLLRETIEQKHSVYSEQQSRLLILAETLAAAKFKRKENLLNFQRDAQEPQKLIALKATNFDFQMLDVIRRFFQHEQDKLTPESELLDVSNSFVISAALLTLASLIESIELERLKDE